MGKNFCLLACKFDIDQSECKSLQVHTSPDQMKLQVDAGWQLVSPGGCSGVLMTGRCEGLIRV